MIAAGAAAFDVSRCPDMEGIETLTNPSIISLGEMSVGAPTWRGLKPSSALRA